MIYNCYMYANKIPFIYLNLNKCILNKLSKYNILP